MRATRLYASGWRAFGIPQAVASAEDVDTLLGELFNAVLVAAASHRPA
jgi:hypothetical protein